MPAAIVTGATGILGRAIVHELGRQPQKWTQVHAISRSKQEAYPPTVKHSHLDLTASVHDMAEQLSGVKGDYLFFAAYLQRSSDQELLQTNGAMLANFLTALALTGAATSLKRVVLVTGAKQYGVHLGRPKQPMEESDPWVEGLGRPPNFYYEQQRILKDASAKGRQESGGWDWTVTYPNDVIGMAKGNFMNMATAIGLYCAVNKELGQPLGFPGSETFYRGFDCFTDAGLHARFCEWAATAPGASNEAFNVVNGDTCSWQTLWPLVGKHFRIEVPAKQFAGPPPDPSEMKLASHPPIAGMASELGLEGSEVVKQSRVEQRIDLVRWSQRSDVKAAWDRLAAREGLERATFENATWGFLGFVLGRNYDIVISMSKARSAGWNGYMDTWDSLRGVFDELSREKILPK